MALAIQTAWSRRATKVICDKIRRFQPDVMHVHNTLPLISPSVYWAAGRVGVPVVQTLHNFRLLCLQAMLLRDGHPCEDCVGKAPWRGVIHRCYRGSTAQSTVLAGSVLTHRALGTYRNKVSRYIALTEFSRKKFVEGGMSAEKIVVKPNFAVVSYDGELKRAGGLFVGRLSQEKGIDVMLAAVQQCPEVTVRVAGEGPEAHKVRAHTGIVPLGLRSRSETLDEMRRAEYLLLPSICYENFPLTVVEAFASGLPVIASRLGAMAELIADGQTGLLFDPGSAEDLAVKIKWAEANRDRMHEMGEAARAVYESRYTPEQNHSQLMGIYASAIAATASGRSG